MLPALNPPPLPNYAENKIARARINLLCLDPEKGEQWKAQFYERCKRDFVFFADHFCYAYLEQKAGGGKTVPLVMFGFQKEMALDIIGEVFKCLEDDNYRWNGGGDKARKMTATFTSLLILLWLGMFHGVSSIITSKTLADVDVQEDMNSPFQRLRWQIKELYTQHPWLFPPDFDPDNKKCCKAKLISFKNGGQIVGMAPDGKSMRQARALIWLADEFAFVDADLEVWQASAATIRMRLVYSTPNGPNCKFSRLVNEEPDQEGEEPEQFHVYELDWWQHPEYATGLYRRPDGTLSSPYFDMILKSNTRQVVAKEYLRDHNESLGGMVYGGTFRAAQSVVVGLQPDHYVKTIWCCWDPGVNFGITFCQLDRWGRLCILQELYQHHDNVKGKSLLDFMAMWCKRVIADEYEEFDVVHIGDPYATAIQLASQKSTEYQLLEKDHGIRVQSYFMQKMPTNERRKKRIEILKNLMGNDVEITDGKGGVSFGPKILVDRDRCKLTVKAFRGKYRYRVEKDGTVTEEILKTHPYTEVADCVGMTAIKLFHKEEPKTPGRTNKPKGRGSMRPTTGRMRATRNDY